MTVHSRINKPEIIGKWIVKVRVPAPVVRTPTRGSSDCTSSTQRRGSLWPIQTRATAVSITHGSRVNRLKKNTTLRSGKHVHHPYASAPLIQPEAAILAHNAGPLTFRRHPRTGSRRPRRTRSAPDPRTRGRVHRDLRATALGLHQPSLRPAVRPRQLAAPRERCAQRRGRRLVGLPFPQRTRRYEVFCVWVHTTVNLPGTS